jgi:hypothetical protein
MPTFYKRNGYFIIPSNKQHKKYDVYDKDDNFVVSFGDKRYQQYKDKFGYYSNKDHGDKQRRENYRQRHSGDKINNPRYAGYWAYNYLW